MNLIVDSAAGNEAQAGDMAQVLVDGHLRVEGRAFRKIAQYPLRPLRLLVQIRPPQQDTPGGRGQAAAEHAHGGRLSGAVGAKKADDLTGAKRDIESLHGDSLTVSAGQFFGADQRCGHEVRGSRDEAPAVGRTECARQFPNPSVSAAA